METYASRDVRIMGIVNLTDDSFFAESRNLGPDGRLDAGSFERKVRKMIDEGADILDLGACSTRPGSESVSEDVEWQRLEPALRILASEYSGFNVSIDTFRPRIAEKAFDIIGPFTVNDVSGGCERMWETAGRLSLPYVAMHTRGTPMNMQSLTDYEDVTKAVHDFFEEFTGKAGRHGIKEWILDPGFGFAKTVEQNWQLLREMPAFRDFGVPVLAGVSRKSFIYKPLGITPETALEATQVANFIALQGGADILRVHDVASAVRTLKMYRLLGA